MDYDLVIQNGILVTAKEIFEAELGIKDGQIAAVGKDLQGDRTIDAKGLLVIPGAVDPHVHLQMPAGATTSSDNWETGTAAGAFGGTTTVMVFVEPEANQSLIEAFEIRRAQADPQVFVDYVLHMTLSSVQPERMAELPAVIDAGMTSFKAYTTYEGMKLNDAEFLEMLAHVHQSGGLVMVHSENDAICQHARESLLAAGKLDPAAHPLSRPSAAEAEAIERVLAMAETTRTPVYIVHISTGRGADAVRRAQERGQTAFGETCTQYLLLTDKEYSRPDFEGAKFVCAPPLRTVEDQNTLWKSLADGVVQTIGTDHCPFFFKGQKELGRDNFTKIPGGIPGVEPRLSLIYSYGVKTGKITLNQWVDLCCTNPAKLFGIHPQKGTLMPGADADIVLFDPNKTFTLTSDHLHENVDYTPYEGFELQGYPVMTIRRGKVLVQDGKLQDKPGSGQYLKCGLPEFQQTKGE